MSTGLISLGALQASNNTSVSNAGLSLSTGNGSSDAEGASNIASLVDSFSNTISPVTGSAASDSLDFATLYPEDASPSDILVDTNNALSEIMPSDGTASAGLTTLPEDQVAGVPDFGLDPNAMDILSSVVQFQSQINTLGGNTGTSSPAFPDLYGQINSIYSGLTTPSSSVTDSPPENDTATSLDSLTADTGSATTGPIANFSWASLLPSNTSSLPDFIPTNVDGGVPAFLQQFESASTAQQQSVASQWSNPTTASNSILSSSGITSTGGLYEQGVVTNPFLQSGFLTQTNNPGQTYESGLLVANGNGNGVVEGTPYQDYIEGTSNQPNIIDGEGGEDQIIDGNDGNINNIHPGDQIYGGGGQDEFFFNLSQAAPLNNAPTIIQGGTGSNTLILTAPGNPSVASNDPTFTPLSDGAIEVSYDGNNLITSNIQQFVVTDPQGNIGAVYAPSSSSA